MHSRRTTQAPESLFGKPWVLVMVSLAIFGQLVQATGSLNGLPILNGPIPVVPQNDPDMKRGPGDFIHPGLWHTHDDLERIRTGVKEKREPWNSAFEKFSNDSFSQSTVSGTCPPTQWTNLLTHSMTSTQCVAPKRYYAEAVAATIRPLLAIPGLPIRML
jgi:hypothetical protein